MNPVGKALWYIESHFAAALTLDEIAKVSGVSRYHLSRAFGEAFGLSAMRYLRARRLTEAARALAAGAGDILSVALEAGYRSHEAFTRALRGQRRLANLTLVEPIKMDQTMLANLAPPRFELSQPLLIAGLSERYTCDASKAIPAQWQRFMPEIGHVPGQIGQTTYGVRYNSDDDGNFDYLCGVAVASFAGLPAELARVRIPASAMRCFPTATMSRPSAAGTTRSGAGSCRNPAMRWPEHWYCPAYLSIGIRRSAIELCAAAQTPSSLPRMAISISALPVVPTSGAAGNAGSEGARLQAGAQPEAPLQSVTVSSRVSLPWVADS